MSGVGQFRPPGDTRKRLVTVPGALLRAQGSPAGGGANRRIASCCLPHSSDRLAPAEGSRPTGLIKGAISCVFLFARLLSASVIRNSSRPTKNLPHRPLLCVSVSPWLTSFTRQGTVRAAARIEVSSNSQARFRGQ